LIILHCTQGKNKKVQEKAGRPDGDARAGLTRTCIVVVPISSVKEKNPSPKEKQSNAGNASKIFIILHSALLIEFEIAIGGYSIVDPSCLLWLATTLHLPSNTLSFNRYFWCHSLGPSFNGPHRVLQSLEFAFILSAQKKKKFKKLSPNHLDFLSNIHICNHYIPFLSFGRHARCFVERSQSPRQVLEEF
jgi:hypothetical protein